MPRRNRNRAAKVEKQKKEAENVEKEEPVVDEKPKMSWLTWIWHYFSRIAVALFIAEFAANRLPLIDVEGGISINFMFYYFSFIMMFIAIYQKSISFINLCRALLFMSLFCTVTEAYQSQLYSEGPAIHYLVYLSVLILFHNILIGFMMTYMGIEHEI